jgi:hypothetical protein
MLHKRTLLFKSFGGGGVLSSYYIRYMLCVPSENRPTQYTVLLNKFRKLKISTVLLKVHVGLIFDRCDLNEN